MRGFVILLGLLVMLGGGAVAGAQFAPIDLASIQALDSVPGAREFLTTQTALYAGGGAAAFGFLLIIIAAATGGKKERAVVKSPALSPRPMAPLSTVSKTPEPAPQPAPKAKPAPVAPAPQAAAPPPKPAAPVASAAPVAPASPPVQAAPAPRPTFAAAPAPAPAPKPNGLANGATPTMAAAGPAPAAPQPAAPPAPAPAQPAMGQDPRLLNRKRVQDLVTINDAVKAFHARHGAYPKADGLVGANERGAAWIPGLAPDFLPTLPSDPLPGQATQYVYASDGVNYKLLAQGVSLLGGPNVEVLGIKIDPTRNPKPDNAAFGFWTPGFAEA